MTWAYRSPHLVATGGRKICLKMKKTLKTCMALVLPIRRRVVSREEMMENFCQIVTEENSAEVLCS